VIYLTQADVTADLVLNFVAVTTGVIRGKFK